MFMFEKYTFYCGKRLGNKSVYYITSHSVDIINSPAQHSYYLGDVHLLNRAFFQNILDFAKATNHISETKF